MLCRLKLSNTCKSTVLSLPPRYGHAKIVSSVACCTIRLSRAFIRLSPACIHSQLHMLMSPSFPAVNSLRYAAIVTASKSMKMTSNPNPDYPQRTIFGTKASCANVDGFFLLRVGLFCCCGIESLIVFAYARSIADSRILMGGRGCPMSTFDVLDNKINFQSELRSSMIFRVANIPCDPSPSTACSRSSRRDREGLIPRSQVQAPSVPFHLLGGDISPHTRTATTSVIRHCPDCAES
jgi:hypothetical protein